MDRYPWIVLLSGLGIAAVVIWWNLREGQPEGLSAGAGVEAAPLVPWGEGLPREGQWRHGFELVDFDGDGHLDLVHGPPRKASARVPRVFLGDGAGRFREDTSLRFPPVPLDYGDVASLDLDGDGRRDLVVASHLQGLTVLLGREGGFTPAPLPPEVASFASRALAVADVDGDGHDDLVASSEGPRAFSGRGDTPAGKGGLVVLRGGASELRVERPRAEVTAFGDSLAIGDVDGAGGVEIVTASGVVGSDHLLYRRGDDGGFVLERLAGVPEGALVRAVALASDDDGTRVLLGGLVQGESGMEGTLDVVRFTGGSATRLFEGAPLRAVSAIGTGDLDADGLVDVVFGEEDGTLHVLRGARGPKGFVAGGSLRPEPFGGCAPYGIALRDLDGQPGDEVVVSFAGEGEGCPTGGGVALYRAPYRAP